MISTPAFLDSDRPDVPNLVIPRGVTPFYLEGQPVRGRLIRLGVLADAMLTRHDNPRPVSALAGRALALVAALASSLKFQGSFSLQIKGDGPVSLLIVDCTDSGALRFHARVSPLEDAPDLLSDNASPTDRDLLGNGYLALTADQGPDSDLHQGIVEISGESLAEMASHYFSTSEQHAVHIHLVAGMTDEGWRAGALILERIASDGGIQNDSGSSASDDDAWHTATVLAKTLTEAELLSDNLPPETLLHRLFHEQDLRIGQSRALAYGCRCSRAKLASVLGTFSDEDLEHMTDDGAIIMTCEFCNVGFRFDRNDVGASRD